MQNGTYKFTDTTELAVTPSAGIIQSGGLAGKGDLNSVAFTSKGGTTIQTGGDTSQPRTLPYDLSACSEASLKP